MESRFRIDTQNPSIKKQKQKQIVDGRQTRFPIGKNVTLQRKKERYSNMSFYTLS